MSHLFLFLVWVAICAWWGWYSASENKSRKTFWLVLLAGQIIYSIIYWNLT